MTKQEVLSRGDVHTIPDMVGNWMLRATKRLALALDRHGEEKYRKRRGWQKLVADEIGIDRSLVSKVLTGDRETVRIDSIQRTAAILGIPPAWFFDDRDVDPDWRKYSSAALEPSLDEEQLEDQLERMQATEAERKAMHSQLRAFPHHRVTAVFLEAFVYGLRAGGAKASGA